MDDQQDSPRINRRDQAEAQQMGFYPIQVFVRERSNPDEFALNAFIYSPFVPRRGDSLVMEDGQVCIVDHVTFPVARSGSTGFPTLNALVYASFGDPDGED